MWTLKKSLKFVRKLESILAMWGWHCGLTGGVLTKEKSKHDLDIVVYPHDSTVISYQDLHYGLEEAGLRQFRTSKEMILGWQEKGSKDQKRVEVWLKNKKRIDVIIWPKNSVTVLACVNCSTEKPLKSST